jgi:hypothetical protein
MKLRSAATVDAVFWMICARSTAWVPRGWRSACAEATALHEPIDSGDGAMARTTRSHTAGQEGPCVELVLLQSLVHV